MSRTIRIIICGSRTMDYMGAFEELATYVDQQIANLHKQGKQIIIFSGAARGADAFGERYARSRKLGLELFRAQWDAVEGKRKHQIGTNRRGKPYWKGAGYARNRQMAAQATHCIAFHDGQSRGTQHMIDLCKERGLPTRVKRIRPKQARPHSISRYVKTLRG